MFWCHKSPKRAILMFCDLSRRMYLLYCHRELLPVMKWQCDMHYKNNILNLCLLRVGFISPKLLNEMLLRWRSYRILWPKKAIFIFQLQMDFLALNKTITGMRDYHGFSENLSTEAKSSYKPISEKCSLISVIRNRNEIAQIEAIAAIHYLLLLNYKNWSFFCLITRTSYIISNARYFKQLEMVSMPGCFQSDRLIIITIITVPRMRGVNELKFNCYHSRNSKASFFLLFLAFLRRTRFRRR